MMSPWNMPLRRHCRLNSIHLTHQNLFRLLQWTLHKTIIIMVACPIKWRGHPPRRNDHHLLRNNRLPIVGSLPWARFSLCGDRPRITTNRRANTLRHRLSHRRPAVNHPFMFPKGEISNRTSRPSLYLLLVLPPRGVAMRIMMRTL